MPLVASQGADSASRDVAAPWPIPSLSTPSLEPIAADDKLRPHGSRLHAAVGVLNGVRDAGRGSPSPWTRPKLRLARAHAAVSAPHSVRRGLWSQTLAGSMCVCMCLPATPRRTRKHDSSNKICLVRCNALVQATSPLRAHTSRPAPAAQHTSRHEHHSSAAAGEEQGHSCGDTIGAHVKAPTGFEQPSKLKVAAARRRVASCSASCAGRSAKAGVRYAHGSGAVKSCRSCGCRAVWSGCLRPLGLPRRP